ncbi:MAG: GatB/YqeY domain-containing protein [Chloroflexota bacterium]|nr:GatB/YqeY domain-containing protein [Chloroflexota bacterium]
MEESVRRRLEDDLKTAMRGGDTATRDAVRYLLAAIKNAEIEHRGPLPPAEEQAVLRRVAKQLSDAVEQYRGGGREDLAEREESQLVVLRRYLPTELSDDELASLANEVVRAVGATGPKDMGKVMPALIERAAGRADGRRLSAAARQALTSAT